MRPARQNLSAVLSVYLPPCFLPTCQAHAHHEMRLETSSCLWCTVGVLLWSLLSKASCSVARQDHHMGTTAVMASSGETRGSHEHLSVPSFVSMREVKLQKVSD